MGLIELPSADISVTKETTAFVGGMKNGDNWNDLEKIRYGVNLFCVL